MPIRLFSPMRSSPSPAPNAYTRVHWLSRSTDMLTFSTLRVSRNSHAFSSGILRRFARHGREVWSNSHAYPSGRLWVESLNATKRDWKFRSSTISRSAGASQTPSTQRGFVCIAKMEEKSCAMGAEMALPSSTTSSASDAIPCRISHRCVIFPFLISVSTR